MRFVCDSCRAQYMISDDKVGAKGVKVRCKKCGFVILVKKGGAEAAAAKPADEAETTMGPVDGGGEGGGQAANGNSNGIFGGMDDDELGAAFDQALGSPNGKPSTNDLINSAMGAPQEPDENDSTRVMDAEAMKKLADATLERQAAEREDSQNSAPAQHEWFVAIDEKQSGPFSVARIKELWDRGEVGPDSLTWRAGLSDWQPMSDIQELAAVLAPKPVKPVIVPSVSMGGSGMMNVPVESAFNAGGVNKTVRTEVPVMAASPQETGGWKPSAASALASLVKDELDTLSRPPPQQMGNAAEAIPTRGLLDLPGAEAAMQQQARSTGVMSAMQAPAEPAPRATNGSYVGPSTGQYSAYVPPAPARRNNSPMYIAIAGVAVVLLVVFGLLFYLISRPNQQPQVVYIPPAPQQVAPPVAVAQKTPPPAATAAPATATPGTVPAGAIAAASPTLPSNAVTSALPSPGRHGHGRGRVNEPAAPGAAATPVEAPGPGSIPDSVNSDKDFDNAFGGGDKPKEAPAKVQKKSVYIPEAPGSASIPERLEQGDIFQVVVAKRPNIMSCVGEQKKRDPSVSGGTLVMHWTITPAGRVTNVSVAPQSADLKSSYLAGCLTTLVKSFEFPKHKVQGDPIDFPFKF